MRMAQLIRGRARIHTGHLSNPSDHLGFSSSTTLFHDSPPRMSDPRQPAWRVLEERAACVPQGSFIFRDGNVSESWVDPGD